MIKLLIFENEIDKVKNSFTALSKIKYNNEICCRYMPRSQDFEDYKKIKEYDLVFVDLDLSTKSDKDGYSVIKEIQKVHEHPQILILTGASDIKENLRQKGMDIIPTVQKPINFRKLNKFLEEML